MAGYYAVIPANVRYDKDLNPCAKLLYGEITALCSEKGFCWATNGYFAELYSATIRSVQRWLKDLADRGYISVEVSDDKRKITLQHVSPCRGGVTNLSWGDDKNVVPPHDKNVVQNTTVFNNTENIETPPLTPDDIDEPETVEVSAKKSDVFLMALSDFEAMRKKIRAPLTGRAKELLLRKLELLAPGDDGAQADILNQSVFNSWRGVFALKVEGSQCARGKPDPYAEAMREAEGMGYVT